MSEFDDQEEETGWDEYWFVCGGVSEAAKEAIEAVSGRVERLMVPHGVPPMLYGVCLLYDDEDDDQGFTYHTDDGEHARQLYICSADAHHDLYIYCPDGSLPRFESSALDLRIVTEAEWFEIADKRGVTDEHITPNR